MADRREQNERRTTRERRSRRDRLRSQHNTVAVVEVTNSQLRIAILRHGESEEDGQVKAHAVTWGNESSSLNSEQGSQQFIDALGTIVGEHDIQSASFHFVLGGELCVTKTVRGSSEKVRNELKESEERSRLYLSLGPGDKVMVSHTQAIDARHEYALAAVCNQATLNTIHTTAEQLGIQVLTIEPALLSVNRAVNRLTDVPSDPYLLMHVDGDSVEVGVCHAGQLLLDFRPGGRGETAEVGTVLDTHINRLKRHAGRQLRSAPPDLNVVYLCGDRDTVSRASQSIEKQSQFEVRVISPSDIQATWQVENTVDDSMMVPALGTLLCSYLPNEERGAPNFMRHIIASTRAPVRPVIIRSLLPVAAMILFAVFGFLFNQYQARELAALQQDLDNLTGVQTEHRSMRLKITSLEQEMKAQKQMLAKLRREPVHSVVTRVGHCMPRDVWLSELIFTDLRTVRLSGSSLLENGIFEFTQWLSKAPEFQDVALRSTSPGNSRIGPVVDFNVEINCDDPRDRIKEVASNE